MAVLGSLGLGLGSACGGGEPKAEPVLRETRTVTATASADVEIVEEAPVSRLARGQVIPRHIILLPGETTVLSAAAYDQQGKQLSDVQFRWEVLSQEAGSITLGGVFTAGFTRGTFNDAILVIANPPAGSGVGPVEARASVTVIEPRGLSQPAGIRTLPDRVEVPAGGSTQLFAYAVDLSGTVIPGMDLQWEMTQPAAGSITGNGLLQGGDVVGTFTDAVQVNLLSANGTSLTGITTKVDVTVISPEDLAGTISAVVLPQVISLRPGQGTKFVVLVLDDRGNQLVPAATGWETLDSSAGSVEEDGLFTAGAAPGIYPDAVRATIDVGRGEERASSLTTTATVIVVDIPEIVREPGQLQNVAVFPSRVTLSPGESIYLSVVSLDGNGHRLSDTEVKWSLAPALGSITSSGKVTAANSPGIHEGAIHVEVSQGAVAGPVSRTIDATLIIRGELARVELTPQKAIVALEGRVTFRATGFDESGIPVQNTVARWSVTNEEVGAIDANGAFIAGKTLGEYPGAVRVEMVQTLSASEIESAVGP